MFRRGGVHWYYMVKIIIIFLLYVDDIVLFEKMFDVVHKKLKCLQPFCKIDELIINIDKTNIMVIKSNKIIYPLISFGDNTLEQV